MKRVIVTRPAEARDLPALGRMAGALVRLHHALDPARFFLVEGVEAGYEQFLGSQLRDPRVVLAVAEHHEGAPVGYAYARLEPRDWNALLDACGALHDIHVEPGARRQGVGQALLEHVAARLRELGAPRLVLSAAVDNDASLRLFERFGFRRTMIEMTLELPPKGSD
jgi:ribosomal protein S18 acetylase RimI-like enzyme